MQCNQFRIFCWMFLCLMGATPSVSRGTQSVTGLIAIPAIEHATIDSQESDSVDFVLPAGKGAAAVEIWLAKFSSEGWKVKLVDQDSMSAEYELTRNSQTLEIELDDPGFFEAEISISCDSDFQLAIEGAAIISKSAGPSPVTPTIEAPSQADSRPGETSLGSVADLKWETEEGWKPDWWLSPNGKRFACRRWTGSGATIAVDGSETGNWDTIDSELVFSPDSQHHAFVADRDENGKLWYYLVVDGVPGKAYEKLDDEISFTADSSQVIFGQEHDDGTSILIRPVDSKQEVIEPGYRFAAYQNFFFRGPHNGIGYVAAFSDREEAFFWNGKQIGERFADIDPGHIAVSPDGQHVAFFAEISPVRLGLVLDGKITHEHNQFDQGTVLENGVRLSPDGKHVIWSAKLNDQEFMYFDGKPGAGYGFVDLPVFSKDGSRFSHVAMKDGSPVIVIDGVESEKYAMAAEPEFSDDGRTWAHYAELGGKQFMVVNGKRQAEFDQVYLPVVSRDGSVVAYAASKGDQELIVMNGVVKATHEIVGTPQLMPNSNSLMWLAFDEAKKWRAFVDGVEKFAFEDFAGAPSICPDGQHLAVVTTGDKGDSMMIDGKAGEFYDRIIMVDGIGARFDEAGNCHYLAVRNDELFLVQTKLAK